MLYDAVVKALPAMALWFIVAGGVLYSLGVIFHAWQRLRFQNAIWHCFVLLGAACHYTAVLDLGSEPEERNNERRERHAGDRQGRGRHRRRQRHRPGAVRGLSSRRRGQGRRRRYRSGSARELSPPRSVARPSNAMSARKRTSSTSSRRPSGSSARSRCSAPMPASAAASIRCRSMPAAPPTSRGREAGPFMSWRMSMPRGI